MSHILPHFTRSLLTRSLAAWAFLRIAATASMGAVEAALGMEPSNPLRLNPFAALFVVAMVAAAGHVSMRRRNEDTFLLYLGYTRLRQTAIFAAPAVVLEMVMRLAVAP